MNQAVRQLGSDFGDKLRELRLSAGLSVKQLAAASGVAELSIANYERRRWTARAEVQSALLEVLTGEPRSDQELHRELRGLVRDRWPWRLDAPAKAAVRMHRGGLTEEQVAELLYLPPRDVRRAVASALAKLRSAAEGEGEQAQLVREWLQDVLAVQGARDARRGHHEPDSDSWDPEGETRLEERYSRTREAHGGILKDSGVKCIRTRGESETANPHGYVRGRHV